MRSGQASQGRCHEIAARCTEAGPHCDRILHEFSKRGPFRSLSHRPWENCGELCLHSLASPILVFLDFRFCRMLMQEETLVRVQAWTSRVFRCDRLRSRSGCLSAATESQYARCLCMDSMKVLFCISHWASLPSHSSPESRHIYLTAASSDRVCAV